MISSDWKASVRRRRKEQAKDTGVIKESKKGKREQRHREIDKGKKGTTATQTDDAKSVYTSYTRQEKNWGPLKQQEAWGKECY